MLNRPATWLFTVLAGCSFLDQQSNWSEQLDPSGPCWEVNLVNGLDESDTSELHNLFECLNQSGNFDAFIILDETLETPDRNGNPLGMALIKASNQLPTSGYDVFGITGKLIEIIQTYQSNTDLFLESTVEMIYGTPYHHIDEDFDLDSESALEQGPAVAFIMLASETASVVLDEGQAVPDRIVEIIDSDVGQDGICQLAGLVHTDDAELAGVAERLVPAIADAWIRSNNTANNLWQGDSGNSIRDLLDEARFGQDGSFIHTVQTPLTSILQDSRVQTNTKQVLLDAARNDYLEHLPTQVLYLANVDPHGIPLTSSSSSGISALQAGARLIANSNMELECEVLGFEFEFDNMATSILRELAERDADDVTEGLELISSLLGSRLTQAVAEEIADSGVCPAINRQMLSDLKVINRLQDPAVGDLVIVVHGMLDAVYDQGNYNRLPEVVDILSALHEEGLTPAIDELLRDIGPSPFSQDVSTWIATLNDPNALQVDACPEGAEPYDFDQLWETAADVLTEDASSPLKPIGIHLLQSDRLWTFIDRSSALAVQDDASVHALPDVLVEIVADQNVRDVQTTLLPPINDPNLWEPAMLVVESTAVRDALISPTTTVEGPLPFVARLIRSDTVTVMLQTIELILDSLGSGDDTASP